MKLPALAVALIGASLLAASCTPISIAPSSPAGSEVTPSPEPSTSASASSEPTSSAGPTTSPGASTGPTKSPPGATSTPPSGTLASTRRIFVIVLENKEADEVLGNGQAPYFNALAARYGVASNYFGITHPSLPNYLALWSGSTHGVSDDAIHDLLGPTVADQLEAAGRTWHVFAEHVPPDCYLGATARDGRDGPGWYARKHEPAISFRSVSSDRARCARISDFTSFDPRIANLQLIVPDLCHDMHDCSVARGDAWLRGFVPRILDSAAWQNGGVLVITFDEGGLRNQVATLVIRPNMALGIRSSVRHDHYDLLRTIEDAFGLPCLAAACRGRAMNEFFAP